MVLMLVGQLMGHEAAISTDEWSRVCDNILTERLWHSVRPEEVYVREYGGTDEAVQESVWRDDG